MFSANTNSEIKVNDHYTKYGECRCCMAKGLHRDVTKEYYYNNLKEVYRDIFMQCFNLALTLHNCISPLICENCVHRLRDATSFRMMVVGTEEQLLNAVIFKSDLVNDTEFVDVSGPLSVCQNFTTEVKIKCESENIHIEPDILRDGWEGSKDFESIENKHKSDVVLENESEDFDYDDSISTTSTIFTNTIDDEPYEVIEGETELLSRFRTSVRPLPKRSELPKICPEYVKHLKRLEDKIVKPKSIEWFFKKPDLDEKFVSEKIALATNATTLFEHSNATAFKTKMRNGYPCFYCREVYKYDKLREHQEKHPKASIYKLLCKYNADEFVVYADITDLKCSICNEKIKNLNELKTHLYGQHAKRIYLRFPDRVIPFKLKERDFECQICERNYETFGAVEKHMNTHYRNFICEECGAGFITKHRLGVHTYIQHKVEKVVCNVCKKHFRSQMKYKLHYDGVHRMLKKYKCPMCPEKFIDYFTRQKHLVDIHAEEPILYKCNVCDKAFNRKFGLSSHVKRCHLEQRDIKCQQCSYTCYTNTELKEHVVKHGGAKFECSVCKKSYGRHRSLMQHMRTHDK